MSKRIPPRPAQEKQRHMNKNPALPPLENTYRAARTTDEERNQPEPEMVPPDVEDEFAKENRTRFEVVRAEEIQRRKVRSLVGRLRTLAIERTKAGEDPIPALEQAVIDLEKKRAS